MPAGRDEGVGVGDDRPARVSATSRISCIVASEHSARIAPQPWRLGPTKVATLLEIPMSDYDSGSVDAGAREESSSDRSLLKRFRRGEADAATLLFLRYAGRLGSLT